MSKCYLKSKYWPCFLKNKNCENKNKNWTCVHELKCLQIFKQIESSLDLLNDLCKNLAEDEGFFVIGNTKNTNIEESRIYSIKQKIYNIHSLSNKKIIGLGIRKNSSETTKEIFKEYKDYTIEELKQKLKDSLNSI